jgi:hypothetical protein
LCEGEHDASVLAGLGINAVAVPHGAGTWRAAWGKALAGWSVAVLAHNDEAGLRHAERVRAELGPLVPEVRVGRPPDPFNDAAEMIEAGLRPEHVVTVERPAAAPALTKEEDRRGAEEVLSSSFVRPVESRGLRYGLIGEIVGVIEPDTEAGSVAVLVSLLAGASAMIGRGPHPMIANTRHPLTVWPLIFGRTTDGRKGESWSSARAVLDRADALFMADNVASGLSSGEGLIARLAENEDRPPVGDRARVVRGDGSYPPRRQCPATSTPRRLGWSPRHAHAAHRRRTRPAPTKGKKSRISPCEGPVLLKRTLRGGQRQWCPALIRRNGPRPSGAGDVRHSGPARGQLRTVGSPHCSRLVSIPPDIEPNSWSKGSQNWSPPAQARSHPVNLWDHAPSCSAVALSWLPRGLVAPADLRPRS